MADIHSVAAKLQCLVKDILKDDPLSLEGSINKLFGFIDSLPPLSASHIEHRAVQPQVEECAVSLWNFAVTKRIGGKLSDKLNAVVRDVSTRLMFCSNPDAFEEIILKKQLMMALKSARAWLDVKEYAMADKPLQLANECVKKLNDLLSISSSALDESKYGEIQKRNESEINKDLFKLMCYKAEMAFHKDQHETAMTNVLAAKEMLSKDSSYEPGYLSMLCYNFGVDSFQQGDYKQTVNWLQESFEIGKMQNAVGSNIQARTLRLLANAYMEWDSARHSQKALNAIGLANAEHCLPAGLYLKLKILLQSDTSDKVLQNALNDIMKHTELVVDLGLNAVKLLFKHQKSALAFEALQELTLKYKNSPDYTKVRLEHLSLLLQIDAVQEAKDLAEEIITEHNKGNLLDMEARKQFHLITWEQAAQNYERKQYLEALQWYNYSMSIFMPEDKQDTNLSKLHRNRASCLLHSAQYDKALAAILEAEKYESNSPHTNYIKFKIALLQNKESDAVEALKKMAECNNCPLESSRKPFDNQLSNVTDMKDRLGLICLAAHLATEQSNSNVSIAALEGLVNLSSDSLQVLTAFRCLCRLRLTVVSQATSEDNSRKEAVCILTYIEKVYDKLSTLSSHLSEKKLQDEALWFAKLAWNVAIQFKNTVELLQKFFILCNNLTGLCPEDLSRLGRQKTCLLMAVAASLQLARQSSQTDKVDLYQRAITYISDCHKVCSRIEEFQLEGSRQRDSKTPLLLLLYEFEAHVKLGDGKAEQLFGKALSLPQCDAQTFETISALAMEQPLQNRGLSMKALQIAIKKYLQGEPVDYFRISKVFHNLIRMSFQKTTLDLSAAEETWVYFTNAMDFIENKAKDAYPEIEILWLMTKAWNYGIHMYSTNHYDEAVRWCELAMRLLKRLGSLRENYDNQMTTIYAELLAKVEPDKGHITQTIH